MLPLAWSNACCDFAALHSVKATAVLYIACRVRDLHGSIISMWVACLLAPEQPGQVNCLHTIAEDMHWEA